MLPRGAWVDEHDPQFMHYTLEGSLWMLYYEVLTHLYTIQRLKRAQGLPTRVVLPRVGYLTLPEYTGEGPLWPKFCAITLRSAGAYAEPVRTGKLAAPLHLALVPVLPTTILAKQVKTASGPRPALSFCRRCSWRTRYGTSVAGAVHFIVLLCVRVRRAARSSAVARQDLSLTRHSAPPSG